ncbi:sulfatase-like hydrolase/transferase [Planctomycetota bacterium]
MKKQILIACVFILVLTAGTYSSVSSAANHNHRPNILFLMTDQQRFDAIGYVQERLAQYRTKAKINTPNLDQLLQSGVYFGNAYTPCAVCAPARTVLRTGCSLERTGAQSNSLVGYSTYNRMEQFRQKINSLESFEQILVEKLGYQAAYFGKWHMPDRFHFKRQYTLLADGAQDGKHHPFAITSNPQERVIRFNDVHWETGTPIYTYDRSYNAKFKRGIDALFSQYGKGLTKTCSSIRRPGFGPQYINSYSGYPYDSVMIDTRSTLGLSACADRPLQYKSQPNLAGRDCLDEHLTPSYFTAQGALLALKQFAQEEKPFVITASFHNPHAPMIATGTFFDRYWPRKDNLFVSPSRNDTMRYSDYLNGNGRKGLLADGLKYDESNAIQEWTVPYYALCEEIDYHIGRLLTELKALGLEEDTLVLFTSDHGEMLGAHGMREKNIFLEESAHIPLCIRYPGHIEPQNQVETPVSLLDVFGTLLDYSGAAEFDNGDGISLRRHIENTSFNETYDDEAIVAEWDYRTPVNNELDRSLGGVPSFLCRKGPWKLMISKKSDSSLFDMLYNLEHDPYEMSNVIYTHAEETWLTREEMIGKAEHLKALLIDWMIRMDGDGRYYSNPRYNLGEGGGDIQEIKDRRNWDAVDFWVSDATIIIGKPALVEGQFRKNAWVYFGTTSPGSITIDTIKVDGNPANVTLKGFTQGVIRQGDHQKVAVCFNAPHDGFDPVEVVIKYSVNRRQFQKRITLL